MNCSIWSMWGHLEMSLFLNDSQYCCVFQSFGSIPLSWLLVGLIRTGPLELKSVAVLTERILYLLPHGIIKNQLQLLLLCSVFLCWFKVLCNFRFKFPYPLQWGPPTFSAGHSFAMMSAVLVSMVEVCIQSYVPTLLSCVPKSTALLVVTFTMWF